MKKTISLLLTLALALSLCACGAPAAQADPTPVPAASETAAPTPETAAPTPATEVRPETIDFTDSLGRTVTLPGDISRIAPSGSVAMIMLAAAAPEKLVCAGSKVYEDQTPYLGEALAALPVTGQLYGGKSTLNLEELLSADPQVIIDMGDKKNGMAEDLDALSEQTGLPCIFLEADLLHMAAAFRSLGELLPDAAERCETVAAYVDETMALAAEASAKIPEQERKTVMYTSGTDGLGTNAKGSSQAQVLELVGAENAVVLEDVTSKGGGNLINMEQLYLFDPDVILFTADSIFETAAADPAWQQVRAIAEGTYYEIPGVPYNWMSNPPSMNMLLGIRWLGNLLYPAYFDFDMTEEVQRAYRILWNYDMSGAEAEELLANSTLKR